METTITTVLFDVDGTLVDSNDAHARAWIAALHAAGYDVPFERVRPLLGMGGDQLLPALGVGLRADAEPGRSIGERRKAFFLEREAPRLRPTRGAHALVAHVRASGLQCIIASSAKGDELDVLLRVADVAGLFDAATTSEDAAASKPDPDIVRAALERSATEARRAVMIGDTRYDVEAAAGAGVRAIALRCGGAGDADLAGAAAIFDDPAALDAAFAAAGFERILEPRVG